MVLNKKITAYLILVVSLLVGYYFEENSSGGAKIDNDYLMPFVVDLSSNFENGLLNYFNNKSTLIHSPVFYLIISFGLSFTSNLETLNILYVFISSILPYIFYKVLSTKFKNYSEFLFFFSLIIFISPYFRSSAIWLLGDNLSLIFFSLFSLFLLKSDTKKNFIFISLTFLVLCCYIRYYYCLFYIFFLYKIFFENNYSLRTKIFILLLSSLFALPAIFYLKHIITYHDFFGALQTFGGTNYLNSSLLILSIILFYLIPFFWNDIFKIINFYKKNLTSFVIILFLFFTVFFLNINFDLFSFPNRGGGVLFKLVNFLNFNISITMIIISTISLLILNYIFDKNKLKNYLLIVILIFSLSLNIIYQKYLDPLFIIILFSLIDTDVISEKIKKKQINISLVFIYFFSFYSFSLFYYL